MKKKVLVGMSGGVDSAVAAYLLQKEGYEVCGVTLRTWEGEDGAESRCCEIDDARRVAWKLGIQYYTLNCTREFARDVVDPFAASYLRGQTPNPCVICNRSIKWDKMLYAAKVMEADYVATGHYAHVLRLDNGRYTVKTARYAAKDQTYMLCRLSQEQLAATLMPLGDYSKDDVRRIAREAGLPIADKPDSQEICFVTDGHYSDFLQDYIQKRETIQGRPAPVSGSTPSGDDTSQEKTIPPAPHEDGPEGSPEAEDFWRVPAPGWFVDEDGNRLGMHKGITHYTVGQRKGLGIALGRPVYVKEIRPAADEVVLSDEPALFHRTVLCRDVNFLSIPGLAPGQTLRARSKIRYHHAAADSELQMLEDGTLRIHFDAPVRAPAPGQTAVFYDDNDCLIGGGFIL